MNLPLNFLDISLQLAIIAIILLVTSEMLSSYPGKVNILINKKKLKNAAIITTTLFLITITIRIISITLTP